MSLWIAIAVRPADEGKTRLAAALTPAERADLNQAFFQHTLAVARQTVASTHCVVISRSRDMRAMARAQGAYGLEETGNSFNQALTAASAFACANGATAVLSISSDLPLLHAADLHEMVFAASDHEVVIATDRHGEGTNALLQRPPGVIGYHHGPGSLATHRMAAERLGLKARVITRAGLAFDVDTPEDLLVWSTGYQHTIQGDLARVEHRSSNSNPAWHPLHPPILPRFRTRRMRSQSKLS